MGEAQPGGSFMAGPQRYRLTFEFELRTAGDYRLARHLLKHEIDIAMELLGPRAQSDYLAIEKCDPPETKR